MSHAEQDLEITTALAAHHKLPYSVRRRLRAQRAARRQELRRSLRWRQLQEDAQAALLLIAAGTLAVQILPTLLWR